MELNARNRNLKEFFDRKADGYDDVHIEFMDSKTSLTNNLPEGTKRILDLGGGTGLELIPLYTRFPDARVTVIDLCDSMLDKLREREFADKVTCICGSFFDVEFGTGYDAVISTSSLHHFKAEDKEKLYAKAARCLRDGGIFLNADKFCITQEQEDYWFGIYETNPINMPHVDTPLAICNERLLLEKTGFTCLGFEELSDENYFLMKAIKN